jgi:hypothetical protein
MCSDDKFKAPVIYRMWDTGMNQRGVCWSNICADARFLCLFVVLVGDQYGTSGGGAMSAAMGLWELRRVLPPLWRRLFEHALYLKRSFDRRSGKIPTQFWTGTLDNCDENLNQKYGIM